MRLTKNKKKKKKRNLVLIKNVTYQRETVSERPIRQPLRGYCTSYPKLPCCVFYLRIVDTFLKNNNAPYSKRSKEPQNGFEILVGQTVFKAGVQPRNFTK